MADDRAEKYAAWLVGNQGQKDTPEYQKVADAYKQLRAKNPAPIDPYANKSLDDIQSMYRSSKLVGGSDDVRARIADAYVNKEQQQGGYGLALDDVMRQVARGVPVVGGALDEISAGASSLMGGNYQESLDYQRARDRYRDVNNPTSSTLLQVAGGAVSGLGAARALGIGVNSTVPLATRALTGGAVGVPVGAADQFLRSEGDGRGVGALVGGAVGGVTGAAMPVVGQAVSSGAQRVADFLTSDAMLRRLGISRQAAEVLIRQLGTDLTPAGANRIAQGGPDAMLADAGPASSGLLDTALQRSGPGATAARDAIEQRATQANQQLRGVLDQTFGGPAVGVETRQTGIRQGSAAARQMGYQAAEDQPIDFSTQAGQQLALDIQRLQRSAPWAIEEANTEIAMRGEQPTLVRILDRATRALNSAAQRGERGGALRGNTPLGGASGALADDIRTSLRAAVPEYGLALDTAADPIRRVQATEFGATILNPNVTREQVVEQFARMAGGERRAALQGIRDQIDEIASNVKQMASDPNIDARQLRDVIAKLSSPAARAKVETAVGQNAARGFFGQIGRFARAAELRASVATNSRTYARQATDAQVKAQMEPGVIGLALEGEVPRAIKKAIQSLTGMTSERRIAAEDRLYGEIANALTTTRGQAAQQQLLRLMQAVRARSANRAAGVGYGTAAGGASVGAVAPLVGSASRPQNERQQQ